MGPPNLFEVVEVVKSASQASAPNLFNVAVDYRLRHPCSTDTTTHGLYIRDALPVGVDLVQGKLVVQAADATLDWQKHSYTAAVVFTNWTAVLPWQVAHLPSAELLFHEAPGSVLTAVRSNPLKVHAGMDLPRGQWDPPFLILFVVLILPALSACVLPKYCRRRAIRQRQASKKAR